MKPLVGIVIGSDSDLPVMGKCAAMLEKLDIPYEFSVISAHRTPQKLEEYSRTAKERGLKVVIGGAGGAAALPGVIAAYTSLPVIGVPVKTPALGGVDSLYSIVQMPSGFPVATVAIDGAANAALLAARILAVSDEALSARLEAYTADLGRAVEAKSAKLQEIGWKEYQKQM